jgi:aspartyl-tRNA(Asn)/glutamyl-tRNA(Gln) amidotransferase subunit B
MSLVDTRTPDPKRLISGATGDWEIIIGLEVHAQVTSNSKLFSGSSTEFGKAANSNVSLVDAAMPGMLPVINEECVAQAVRTGLGLKAQINNRSVFDRKNYFYPDLPQGYQISQFKDPIVGEGEDHHGRSRHGRASSRTSRSASSGCTWSRTPASRCTTSTRRCPTST